jgi:hypothetical protein
MVAFLIAAGIHSFHDGVITVFGVRPRSFDESLAQTFREALGRGLAGGAFAAVLAAFLYLLARHGARELTAPGAVGSCPPPWRPRIKTWGCEPVPVAPAVPVAPVAYWSAAALPIPPAPPVVPFRAPATVPAIAWVPVPAPTTAPPGWHEVGGDPSRQGWWTGSTWTRLHWWDGNRWRPE